MQPRMPKLLQTEHALYRIEEWDGVNTSGMIPLSNLILVRTDECNDRSPGGVFYDDEVRERMTLASETGVIVAISTQAFRFTLDGRIWPDTDELKPKVGDRIRFARYAGDMFLGYDKKTYRVMKDSQIGCLFDKTHAPFIELPPVPEGSGDFQFPSVADSIAGAAGESTFIGIGLDTE